MFRVSPVLSAAFLLLSLTACATPSEPRMSSPLPVAWHQPPPSGLVRYCFEKPEACRSSTRDLAPMHLDKARWHDLTAINWEVNRAIRPQSDYRTFGVKDYWTDTATRGDCDDYVLMKRNRLMAQGWPPENLLMTVLDTERGERHVVLLAVTDRGDFVLDNRFNSVMPWERLHYRWIARQSPRHPLRWNRIALDAAHTRQAPRPVASMSAAWFGGSG